MYLLLIAQQILIPDIIGLLQNPGKVIGGSITFEGQDVLAKTPAEMVNFRGSEVAMIFQNPMTCLNPVYTIGNQLMEALKAHDKNISKEEAQKRAMEMLEEVGINNTACIEDNNYIFKFLPQQFQVGCFVVCQIVIAFFCFTVSTFA